MDEKPVNNSPTWSNTTKLAVTLALIVGAAVLLDRFRLLLGPLLLAFVVVYLLYPVIEKLRSLLHLPWKIVVNLVYLVLILFVAGLITWGGLALLEQIQSLIMFLQKAINGLPAFFTNISSQPLYFGPFLIDMPHVDYASLSSQILGFVQPLLSQLGNLVGTFATSATGLIGWLVFIFLVSFFILSETEGNPSRMIDFHIPGYNKDLEKIGTGLSRTWNAFLRRQLIILALTILVYTVLLAALGVHYYFGLALLAGMARLIPYIGPLIAWTTYGLVAYFQGTTIFSISPFVYALIVVGIAYVFDSIMDSLITPRMMADALRVHPAAVLIAALVGLNLFGLIGMILAAPTLASLRLILNYIIKKLLDVDPWEGEKNIPPPRWLPVNLSNSLIQFFQRGIALFNKIKLALFRKKPA
jgi:predicted PurR-regulated permease PerM